jgi:hypothetical protein
MLPTLAFFVKELACLMSLFCALGLFNRVLHIYSFLGNTNHEYFLEFVAAVAASLAAYSCQLILASFNISFNTVVSNVVM